MPDDVPTQTIFRAYADGEVVALFPTIPADPQGHCLSYLHVGQHGAADPGHVIARTRPASATEYAELLDELTVIGYVPTWLAAVVSVGSVVKLAVVSLLTNPLTLQV